MAANARTAAKTAAKKRTTPRPAVVEGDFEPVRITSKPTTERVVLFYVDDQPYDIPKRIGREYGLRYLDNVATVGEAVATVRLMKDVIGEDGYTALMNCEGLEDDDLEQIMERLRDGALGAVEDDGGGRGKGR